jgi:spore coat protein U-like protein
MNPVSTLHRLAAGLLGCLLVLASADSSSAAPPTGCSFVNVQGVRFGTYSPRSPEPLDSVSTILYRCPGIGSVRMELSRGNGGSFQRTMRVRDTVMQYNLYLDAGHSRIWGDGSSGTGVFMAGPTGNGAEKVSVFGRIPPGQRVRIGEYSDQIVVTMLF